MPYYKYKAKKGAEEVIENILEASDKQDAVDKINALGYVAVSLEDVSEKFQRHGFSGSFLSILRRIKLRDLNIFSSQLSSLLKSGVPILKAFTIIAEQTENEFMKDMLNRIAIEIKSGKTFSESLSNYPKIFSPLYIAIIRSGEESGALDTALDRISGYLRNKENILSKIKAALIYPVIMAVVGLLTLVFMLTFVVPKLKDTYLGIGAELPLPTKILLSVSAWMKNSWLWIIILFFILYFVLGRLFKKRKDLLSALKLKMPIYGKFLLKSEIAQLSRSLELSLKSGIKILSAIELSIPVLSNELIKKDFLESYEQIKQGGSFGKNLKKSKVLPAFLSNFIIVGEESGKLNEAFSEIADYYERDTDEALKIFTSQLEPLMILFIGLILGFVVIAMLLPVFQLNLMVK